VVRAPARLRERQSGLQAAQQKSGFGTTAVEKHHPSFREKRCPSTKWTVPAQFRSQPIQLVRLEFQILGSLGWLAYECKHELTLHDLCGAISMNRLLSATKHYYEAKREESIANLEVYFTKSVGIGEHSDLQAEIRKWTDELARAIPSRSRSLPACCCVCRAVEFPGCVDQNLRLVSRELSMV
jgi:hypothetical protein